MVQESLGVNNITESKITASFLAQEAIEYVKSVRDSDFASGGSRLQQVISECASGCTIDTNLNPSSAVAILPCGGICQPLRYDAVSRRYGYQGSGDASPYRRRVEVSPTGMLHEYQLTVDVSWTIDGYSRTLVTERYLYDLVAGREQAEAELTASYATPSTP